MLSAVSNPPKLIPEERCGTACRYPQVTCYEPIITPDLETSPCAAFSGKPEAGVRHRESAFFCRQREEYGPLKSRLSSRATVWHSTLLELFCVSADHSPSSLAAGRCGTTETGRFGGSIPRNRNSRRPKRTGDSRQSRPIRDYRSYGQCVRATCRLSSHPEVHNTAHRFCYR
jgi:hypothetical protein